MPGEATARAGTNIALVKYWGKRDAGLNLPATGSLSLTLADLGTETRVRFGGTDRVLVDGRPADEAFASRVRRFLDLVRKEPAEVATSNSVPTAAGLASSASGFAALALAATRAAGLRLEPRALSALARRGSGSAARSIFGGLVEMHAATDDAYARPLMSPEECMSWGLRLVVAMTAQGPKALGSTEAMERTARTSPYFPAWVAAIDGDLAAARAAIERRDLAALGAVAERNAMRMHASALGADPPILYWTGATVEAIRAVQTLRARGTWAFVTIDAGPHVKALCLAPDAPAVEATLAAVQGVTRTMIATPGPGAEVIA